MAAQIGAPAAAVRAHEELFAYFRGLHERGIRPCAAWDDDPAFSFASLETRPSMLTDPRYAAALRVPAGRGMVFDTWVYHPQIGDVAALTRAVPDCPMVLDQAGTPLGTGA